ncbi:hypothetical protein WA026_001766 [Henosepilachna vigintioctopunctata]|uniref:Large ribosomal subunit protein bL21m n=1 Tax=Henosepilachna vigintioctopunctata TaxID=420089 RepID=A0AAW1UVI6_9CUCU
MASIFKNILPKLISLPRAQFVRKPYISQFCLYSTAPSLTHYEIVDHKADDEKRNLFKSEIVRKINETVQNKKQLFAVVHVAGKQFKITGGDIIVIEGYWPPDAGDKITLDKVMLVGAREFSLIGRPLIQNDLVKVEATVIEKSVSHTKTHFRKKRRKQYQRINFYRIPRTMLQINNIKFVGELDNPPDVTEAKNRQM